MPIFNGLAQTLLFALMMLTLPTTAHTPQKQLPPPQQVDKPAVEHTYTTFEVTAYTKSDSGMNGLGITASGVRAKRLHTIAASRNIPYGTKIFFPELGRTFVVQDRGGAIRKNRIDIFMEDRQTALEFGRRKLKGIILE